MQKNLNQSNQNKTKSSLSIIKRLKTAKTRTSKIALSHFSKKKILSTKAKTPNLKKNSIIVDKKKLLRNKKKINIQKFINFLKTP